MWESHLSNSLVSLCSSPIKQAFGCIRGRPQQWKSVIRAHVCDPELKDCANQASCGGEVCSYFQVFWKHYHKTVIHWQSNMKSFTCDLWCSFCQIQYSWLLHLSTKDFLATKCQWAGPILRWCISISAVKRLKYSITINHINVMVNSQLIAHFYLFLNVCWFPFCPIIFFSFWCMEKGKNMLHHNTKIQQYVSWILTLCIVDSPPKIK